MHYRDFYGLKEDPFNNIPDLRFFYPGNEYTRIHTRLLRVAKEKKGLGVLTGSVGAGKTTIARHLLYLLRNDKSIQSGLLVLMHSEFEPGWLVKRIAGLLGIREIPEDKTEALAIVTKRLLLFDGEGKHTTILIDEANKMVNPDQLEEIRGFLNLEKGNSRIITFLLFGTSDFLKHLERNESLAQRTAMRLKINPMDFPSTVKYIQHRLKTAGGDPQIFTQNAYSLIFKYSKGSPRTTNSLCDNLLFEGALINQNPITESLVAEISEMLGFDKGGESF
ncbi:AAA family ATPase [candidate division WOR-3 bacterium]|nr:AAA family ATPase [candidate division WOR-3 bacterium]